MPVGDRLSLPRRTSRGRIRRALLVGFAIPVMPGAAVLLAITGVQPLIDNWTYGWIHTLVATAVAILAAGCVLGAGLAADGRTSRYAVGSRGGFRPSWTRPTTGTCSA